MVHQEMPFADAVCVYLSITKPRKTARVSSSLLESEVQVNADKSRLGMDKKLYDSAEYDAICTHDWFTRKHIYQHTVQNSLLPGAHFVKVEGVEALDDYLRQRAWGREQLVESFLAVYDSLREKAQAVLGSLFDPSDYPPPWKLRNQFSIGWYFVEIAAPGKLQGLDSTLYQAAMDRYSRGLAEAYESCRSLLRDEMAVLVSDLHSRLSGEYDGTAKTFKRTFTGNINDFLDVFSERDLTNDTELRGLVEAARALLKGVDTGKKIKDENLKAAITVGFTGIKGRLAEMMQAAPGRSVSYDVE